MYRSLLTATLLVLVAGLLALFSAACGDDKNEDRPTASVSASGAPVETGVVQPKPADATQVDVVLKEWSVTPSQTTVRAGKVYFLADNQGPSDPHELVIIQSDLAPDKLPVEKGKVPEEKVKMVDEIEPFAVRSKASITLDLKPG